MNTAAFKRSVAKVVRGTDPVDVIAVLGSVSIAAGVYLLAGLAWALIAVGALGVGFVLLMILQTSPKEGG
jgi:hypothetical protein